MFSRAITFGLLSLAIFVSAATATPPKTPPQTPPKTPPQTPPQTPPGVTPCSTQGVSGQAKCCEIEKAGQVPRTGPAGLILTALQINALEDVGLNCLELIPGSCSNSQVCCTDNRFNGLVNLGCTKLI